jgi:hypothetical protein
MAGAIADVLEAAFGNKSGKLRFVQQLDEELVAAQDRFALFLDVALAFEAFRVGREEAINGHRQGDEAGIVDLRGFDQIVEQGCLAVRPSTLSRPTKAAERRLEPAPTKKMSMFSGVTLSTFPSPHSFLLG